MEEGQSHREAKVRLSPFFRPHRVPWALYGYQSIDCVPNLIILKLLFFSEHRMSYLSWSGLLLKYVYVEFCFCTNKSLVLLNHKTILSFTFILALQVISFLDHLFCWVTAKNRASLIACRYLFRHFSPHISSRAELTFEAPTLAPFWLILFITTVYNQFAPLLCGPGRKCVWVTPDSNQYRVKVFVSTAQSFLSANHLWVTRNY